MTDGVGPDGARPPAAATADLRPLRLLDDWGPEVDKQIRSGSPASEIIMAATEHDAGLVVVAAGGRGISDVILIGSTAQRVQHYAPCPVLVVRRASPPRKTTRRA